MSGRANLRGESIGASTSRSNNNASDSEFIWPRHPLKQLAIDLLAIFSGVLLACVTGVGIAASLYMLLFMDLHW